MRCIPTNERSDRRVAEVSDLIAVKSTDLHQCSDVIMKADDHIGPLPLKKLSFPIRTLGRFQPWYRRDEYRTCDHLKSCPSLDFWCFIRQYCR